MTDDYITEYERKQLEAAKVRYALAGDFAMGWRAALSSAGRCGAFNEAEHLPRGTFALCVRQRGHTGKHDDLYTPPWGDRNATAEQTQADAAESHRNAREAERDRFGEDREEPSVVRPST